MQAFHPSKGNTQLVFYANVYHFYTHDHQITSKLLKSNQF